MRLTTRAVSGLPSLAWCLAVEGETARLVHGPGVETGPDWFVEGAWDAPFKEHGFLRSLAFTGTGGVVEDGRLTLASPCHTTECLYSLSGGGGPRWWSNSLPFLLLEAGDALDPAYLDYEADVMSVSLGLDRLTKSSPVRSGRRLGYHWFCNVDAATGEETPKVEAGLFRAYEQYAAFLREKTRAVAANAVDPARRVQYPPIVFASNGYDSSTCALLAREAGCDEGVVFESKKKVRVDSGVAVLRALGYSRITELDELDYKSLDCADLFLAGGELGTSVFFAAAADQLKGRLLFSGVHGDKVWEKTNGDVNRVIRRSPYPDTARQEFRLVTGYLNFPVPFLGVTRMEDFLRIANMDEMRPWSVGGDYDRPIPRRLLEEKGVPRGIFALSKAGGCATTMRIGGLGRVRLNMPEKSFARFAAEYPRLRALRPWTWERVRRHVRYALHYAALAADKLGLPLPEVFKADAADPKDSASPLAPSFLQLWAVESVQRRYYRLQDHKVPARA